jgi:hypothetical protein
MRVPLLAALPLCASLLEPALATYPTKTIGETTACTVLEKRIAKLYKLSETGLVGGPRWFCDFASYDDKHWFLIALRSDRKVDGLPCNGINCSNLVGWYAVNRHTGAIHDWDMGEFKVGAALANE